MFTGIIEEIGIIKSLIRKANNLKIIVYSKSVIDDLFVGDSVALDGICLTVVATSYSNFTVEASHTTLNTTNLKNLKIGSKVNLERALVFGGRLGGHLVTGHVDGTAEITGKIKKGDNIEVLLKIPSSITKYFINKGSIALDGVSLTIAKLVPNGIVVTLIPQTVKTTTLASKQIGNKVNIEIDVFSKYIEKFLLGNSPSPSEKMMLNSGFFPMGLIEN